MKRKVKLKAKPKVKAGPARTKAAAKKTLASKPRLAAAPQLDAVDMLITASSETLKLPLDPSWHAGVKFNLGLILRLGGMVDEFPLPDDAEPAPIFRA
ncbi:MAG: DUF4089 domain-containing protein [Xanthobacteraceae bacterium]|jgi:hypothetical protein